jgi:hypothetical protein
MINIAKSGGKIAPAWAMRENMRCHGDRAARATAVRAKLSVNNLRAVKNRAIREIVPRIPHVTLAAGTDKPKSELGNARIQVIIDGW